MKTRFYTIFLILSICISVICPQNNQTKYELWEKAQILNDQNNKEEALKIYLYLFEKNIDKYECLKKIKEILIDTKDFTALIDYYILYIDNLPETKHKFETEIELLEIKMWNDDESWINDLYFLEEKYSQDENYKTKSEYILHKIFQNKKIAEGYNFVLFMRSKHNIPYFYSRKLISIFKNNMKHKKCIDESIIYLTQTPRMKKQSSISQKIIIDQIFDLTEKLIQNNLLNDMYLPISNKQFSSNTLLSLHQPTIENYNTIQLWR